MKKTISTQILFILVLFITMGCGCEKDPVEPDYPMEITTQTLDGKWNFVSLFDQSTNTTYTDCDDIFNNMSPWYGKVFLEYDFNSTTETVDVTEKCKGDFLNVNWIDAPYEVIVGNIVITTQPYPYSYEPTTGELTIKVPYYTHLYVTVKQ